jgi:predicted ATP-grasp superfamily ATP-dependent carboligase
VRVLIIEDGLGSYILPAVRSFGRAGWDVGLAGPGPSRAATSRWVRRTHLVPPAESDPGTFAAAVAHVVAEGGYEIVFGGDDVEVLALSRCRQLLATCVPYATHEVVLRAVDKLELAGAAQAAGLAVPHTVAATAESVAAANPAVVVKPRLHWSPSGGGGRVPAVMCATHEEVFGAVRAVEARGGKAILQDRIEGTLLAVTVLCDTRGGVVAESHQVACRVSPKLRTSTRAETRPVEPELSRGVAELMRRLGWFGLANLQFLRPDGGRPHLIDLNGRFYGSLALVLRAGLDLPVRWARLATGEPDPQAVPVARTGVRYQALEEDLRRARIERRAGLLADVVGTAVYAVGAAHSTWVPDDPRPALARVRELARQRWRRRGISTTGTT